MKIDYIMKQKGITKYQLAKRSNIPYTTLNDILSKKTQITKCSAETIYKLSQALQISMESLIEDEIKSFEQQQERERSYEYGLPDYLQHDLDMFKKALNEKSSLLDCLWGELYGSINMAEVRHGVLQPLPCAPLPPG